MPHDNFFLDPQPISRDKGPAPPNGFSMRRRSAQLQALAQWLREHARTQAWLCQQLGLSSAAVSKWFTRGQVSRKHLVRIAALTGLSTDELLGRPTSRVASPATPPYRHRSARGRPVPIVGTVQAGPPGAPSDIVLWADWFFNRDYHNLPVGAEVPDYPLCDIAPHMYEHALRAPNHHVIALRIVGASMSPAYEPDDLVLLELMDNPADLRDLDHVVVDLDGAGNYTLKAWLAARNGDPPLLVPINRDYLAFRPVAATDTMRLKGRALGLFRLRP